MRNYEKYRVLRRTFALLLAGAIGSATGVSSAQADEIDATTRGYAEKLAVTVCGTCHGPQGNNTNPKYPLLAGQNANYLAAQLKAFHSQSRGDPDAISYMWGMASELDDGTMSALAAYYAAIRPDVSVVASQATVVRGREIYQQGIPAQGVPACSSCHGADAHGVGDFPRLAGQHSQYILKQLSSFQNNMRNVAIMHGVAQNLRLQEMQSVAAYLQAQP